MQVSTKRGSSRGVKVENNYRDGFFSVQHWGIDLEQRERAIFFFFFFALRDDDDDGSLEGRTGPAFLWSATF